MHSIKSTGTCTPKGKITVAIHNSSLPSTDEPKYHDRQSTFHKSQNINIRLYAPIINSQRNTTVKLEQF